MRRATDEAQMTEVMKSKMYINQVMMAYQQLKSENQLLQQHLSAVQKASYDSLCYLL
jgi:putative IMPACT (imprinted ancient) family translation regulator